MNMRPLAHRVCPVRFSTRELIAASCLGVAMLGGVAQAGDLSAALDAAPAGAEFVLVIPSMQAASTAVADLTEMFGGTEPEMLDLLGSFKSEMGITAGLDDEGAAVVVMLGVADAIANDDEPEPIVLLPVTDYKAFVESIGGTAGGVTSVILEGDEGFAKQLGDFAVLSESREAVDAYAAGEGAAALMGRIGSYGSGDAEGALIAGFIDVAALRPVLLAKIDEAMAEMTEQMKAELADEAEMPVKPESMARLVESYGKIGRLLLEGVEAAMFSATFDDAGLRGGYAWNVVEGSALSTYFSADRADFAGLLDQLPANAYIMAVSMDTTAMDLGRMSTDMLDAVAQALGDEPMFAGVMEMARESMAIYEQMNATSSVFYAPDMAAMMTGGFFKAISIYDVDDTDAAIEAWKTSMAKLPGMVPAMMAQAGAGEDAPSIDFTFSWIDDALNLGGVDVDQYDLKLVLPPEVMMQMGPAAMMMGNAGFSGYVAAVDGKLVLTTVPDAQLINQGLNAMKAGDGLGTAAVIDAARADLPEGSVMEAFLSLDGIASAANPFLMMVPNGFQIAVPADLPPVAMGVGMDGSAMGAKVIVPTGVLTFVRDTTMQVQDMMMQQQGGGGGGRPPF